MNQYKCDIYVVLNVHVILQLIQVEKACLMEELTNIKQKWPREGPEDTGIAHIEIIDQTAKLLKAIQVGLHAHVHTYVQGRAFYHVLQPTLSVYIYIYMCVYIQRQLTISLQDADARDWLERGYLITTALHDCSPLLPAAMIAASHPYPCNTVHVFSAIVRQFQD